MRSLPGASGARIGWLSGRCPACRAERGSPSPRRAATVPASATARASAKPAGLRVGRRAVQDQRRLQAMVAGVVGQPLGHCFGRLDRAAGKLARSAPRTARFPPARAQGPSVPPCAKRQRRHPGAAGPPDHRPATRSGDLGHGGCVRSRPAECRCRGRRAWPAIGQPTASRTAEPIDLPRAEAAADHVGPRW